MMLKLLHVGCGRQTKVRTTLAFQKNEWTEVRLDIDPAVEPDIVASITNMTSIPDAVFDALFSSHNIEHLYPHEVNRALSEFARVIKPDGFAVITCPDLRAICQLVVQDRLTDPAYESSMGPITPLDMLYGHIRSVAAGNHFMAHRCGFTRKSLAELLQMNGFPTVAVKEDKNYALWAYASRCKLSNEEAQARAAEHF